MAGDGKLFSNKITGRDMSNVPKSIEAFFYGKLISSDLFGEPKDGLLDGLKERVLSGTDEQFDRAAEIIIRERKSGAFPALPICLHAIERAATYQAMPVGGRNNGGRITKETYHEAAMAYGRRVVIRSDEPIRWSAWRRYAESLGLVFMASRLGRDSTQKEWTVPADMPGQFDPSWIDPNPSEAMQSHTMGYSGSDARKREADEMMSKVPKSMQKGAPKRGGTTARDFRGIADAEDAARYADIAAAGISGELSDKLIIRG
jgi:hypothetical protein